MTLAGTTDKANRFCELHQLARSNHSAFVIPNAWDGGSARILEGLGHVAIATTSSGFAQSLGRLDGTVTLGEKLDHCRLLASVTTIPVSADLENGFADDPQGVATTIRRVGDTGVVGGSIEDYKPGGDIYDFALAVERIQAAVEAARSLDFPFTLTARAENLIRGRNDLDDTIRRLQAFALAGADVLFAPGLRTLDDVRTVCAAVDKPVNVLSPSLPKATLDELSLAGAARVSVGGAMARASLSAVLRAGRESLQGSFGWYSEMPPGREVEKLLK